MKPAASANDFLQAPVGCYWAGATWLAFYAEQGIAGFAIWGYPTAADMAGLLRLVALRDSALALPLLRWVDVRKLGSPEPAAFLSFAEYFSTNATALGGLVKRAAVVHSGGLAGALAFGFCKIVPAPYPVKCFSDPGEATSWLELGAGPAFLRELDQAHAAAIGTPPLLRDLRAWLGANLRDISLQSAAAALSMSARTLQRRLSEHRTVFQDEVNGVRLAAAQRMLRDSDAPVTAVAYDVGFGSVHHFSESFRKLTGTAPSHWRAANCTPECLAE